MENMELYKLNFFIFGKIYLMCPNIHLFSFDGSPVYKVELNLYIFKIMKYFKI